MKRRNCDEENVVGKQAQKFIQNFYFHFRSNIFSRRKMTVKIIPKILGGNFVNPQTVLNLNIFIKKTVIQLPSWNHELEIIDLKVRLIRASFN